MDATDTMADRVASRFMGEALVAAVTPDEKKAETAAMLKKKLAGAQKLYDGLKKMGYIEYNIGDFFKKDLPKLRKVSDSITKSKAVLEAQLYRFMRQAKDDLKRLG